MKTKTAAKTETAKLLQVWLLKSCSVKCNNDVPLGGSYYFITLKQCSETHWQCVLLRQILEEQESKMIILSRNYKPDSCRVTKKLA